MARIVFEVFCRELFKELYQQNIIVADEPLDECLKIIKKGMYPSGTRFISQATEDDKF